MAKDAKKVFDEYLVMLATGGDADALDRLAARWRPRHYAHARRMLRDPERAADAVQDAWVNIIRNLKRLNDPTRFSGWSYAIVTRRCQDAMRRRAREPLFDNEADPPDPEGLDSEDRRDLRLAIASLSADQHAAIALFYLEGFDVLEIAQALRAPVGTVKSRLFHARRTLRRYFEGESNE